MGRYSASRLYNFVPHYQKRNRPSIFEYILRFLAEEDRTKKEKKNFFFSGLTVSEVLEE